MAARKPKITWGDDAFELVMKIIDNAASSGKIGKTQQAIKTGRRITSQMQKQGQRSTPRVLNRRIDAIEKLENDSIRYKKFLAQEKAAKSKKAATKKAAPKKKK